MEVFECCTLDEAAQQVLDLGHVSVCHRRPQHHILLAAVLGEQHLQKALSVTTQEYCPVASQCDCDAR